MKDTSGYPLIAAKIVSKSLSKAQSIITINAGSKDSVQPGMPVLNDQGLVGIIHSTSEDFSIVRTLKNIDLKLTVKDERSRVNGILKWNGEDNVIVDIPKTYDIEPGDRIVTSELSSIIPIPLPVGVVMELSSVKTGIFNEVKVKPFVDFVKAEYVFVLGVLQSRQKNNLELNFYNQK
jgi:rod shape-determining protein MreC